MGMDRVRNVHASANLYPKCSVMMPLAVSAGTQFFVVAFQLLCVFKMPHIVRPSIQCHHPIPFNFMMHSVDDFVLLQIMMMFSLLHTAIVSTDANDQQAEEEMTEMMTMSSIQSVIRRGQWIADCLCCTPCRTTTSNCCSH